MAAAREMPATLGQCRHPIPTETGRVGKKGKIETRGRKKGKIETRGRKRGPREACS